MAVGVVDRLKLIKITEQDSERSLIPAFLPVVELAEQCRTIAKSCQSVGQDLRGQSIMSGLEGREPADNKNG